MHPSTAALGFMHAAYPDSELFNLLNILRK